MLADDDDEEATAGAVRYPVMPSLVSLQQMRNRLHMGHLGRKLMKWTSIATGTELRRISAELLTLYDTFAEDMREAFIMLARCRYFFPDLNKMVIEDIQSWASVTVASHTKTITGVRIIEYFIVETDTAYDYLGLGQGGEMIEETKRFWIQLLKLMIKMAELRTSFALVEAVHKAATKECFKTSLLTILREVIANEFHNNMQDLFCKITVIETIKISMHLHKHVSISCFGFDLIYFNYNNSICITMSRILYQEIISRNKKNKILEQSKEKRNKNYLVNQCIKSGGDQINQIEMTCGLQAKLSIKDKKKTNERFSRLTEVVSQLAQARGDSPTTFIIMTVTQCNYTGIEEADTPVHRCCPSNKKSSKNLQLDSNNSENNNDPTPRTSSDNATHFKKIVKIKKHRNDDGTTTVHEEVTTIKKTVTPQPPIDHNIKIKDNLSAKTKTQLNPEIDKASCHTETSYSDIIIESGYCLTSCCSSQNLKDTGQKKAVTKDQCCSTSGLNIGIVPRNCVSAPVVQNKTSSNENDNQGKSRSGCSIKIILQSSETGGKTKKGKESPDLCSCCSKDSSNISNSASQESSDDSDEQSSESKSLCSCAAKEKAKKSTSTCSCKMKESKKSSTSCPQCEAKEKAKKSQKSCSCMAKEAKKSSDSCPHCANKKAKESKSSCSCKSKVSKKASNSCPHCEAEESKSSCSCKAKETKKASNSCPHCEAEESKSSCSCKVKETKKASNSCPHCEAEESKSSCSCKTKEEKKASNSCPHCEAEEKAKESKSSCSCKAKEAKKASNSCAQCEAEEKAKESKSSCSCKGKEKAEKSDGCPRCKAKENTKKQSSNSCPKCKTNDQSAKELDSSSECQQCKDNNDTKSSTKLCSSCISKTKTKIDEISSKQSANKCPHCAAIDSSQKQTPKSSCPKCQAKNSSKDTNNKKTYGGLSFENNLHEKKSKCKCSNAKQNEGNADQSKCTCGKNKNSEKEKKNYGGFSFEDNLHESKNKCKCKEKGKKTGDGDQSKCPKCKVKGDSKTNNKKEKTDGGSKQPCTACKSTQATDVIEIKTPCCNFEPTTSYATIPSAASVCQACQTDQKPSKSATSVKIKASSDAISKKSHTSTNDKKRKNKESDSECCETKSPKCTKDVSVSTALNTRSEENEKPHIIVPSKYSKKKLCPVCSQEKCASVFDYSKPKRKDPPKHKCDFDEEPGYSKESLPKKKSVQSAESLCQMCEVKLAVAKFMAGMNKKPTSSKSTNTCAACSDEREIKSSNYSNSCCDVGVGSKSCCPDTSKNENKEEQCPVCAPPKPSCPSKDAAASPRDNISECSYCPKMKDASTMTAVSNRYDVRTISNFAPPPQKKKQGKTCTCTSDSYLTCRH